MLTVQHFRVLKRALHRQLLDCSRELLSALVEASKSGSKSIVMDTFRRHAPFLTMYAL